MTKEKKPMELKTKIILIVVFGVLLLIGGIQVLLQESPDSSDRSNSSANSQAPESIETWRDKDNIDLARNMTKDFVKKNLRSPSTAKFPGLFELKDHITYLGDQRYKTVSWVDAQNGLGAVVRMNYTAIVVQTDKLSWRLESLEFDE